MCLCLLHDMESNSLCFITHQEIFNVVRSGDFEGLKELMKQLNKCESFNGSSSICESSNGSSSISEIMYLQNDAGETLLFIAAENGFKEVFSFLLSFCDLEVVKIRAKSDMNAFHVAAKRGHLGIFFLLSLISSSSLSLFLIKLSVWLVLW